MNHLKTIEDLCEICTAMAKIIVSQQTALEQLEAVTAEEETADARRRYSELTGSDWPAETNNQKR